MRLKTALLISLAALALAACGDGGPDSPGSVTFESPTSAPTTRAAEGSAILNFKAPRLGGGQIQGGDLEGKDVAIWFWAPW